MLLLIHFCFGVVHMAKARRTEHETCIMF